jgi:hypothetical protein
MGASGSLAGRAALVTGGASGIGAGIAAALESAGARVAVADLDDAPIRRDLRRPGEAARMVAEAVEDLGGLDVVVNRYAVAKAGMIRLTTALARVDGVRVPPYGRDPGCAPGPGVRLHRGGRTATARLIGQNAVVEAVLSWPARLRA